MTAQEFDRIVSELRTRTAHEDFPALRDDFKTHHDVGGFNCHTDEVER